MRVFGWVLMISLLLEGCLPDEMRACREMCKPNCVASYQTSVTLGERGICTCEKGDSAP